MQSLLVLKMCYLPGILIFVLFRALQKNKSIRIYWYLIYLGIFIIGMAHALIEANKSHDLPSASWRGKEDGGIIQPEFKGHQDRQCPKAGKMDVLAKQRENSRFSHIFILIRTSMGCMIPAYISEGDILYLVIQFTSSNSYLFQKHPHTDTPRNNILPALWAPLSPVRRTHKINHQCSKCAVPTKEACLAVASRVFTKVLLHRCDWQNHLPGSWAHPPTSLLSASQAGITMTLATWLVFLAGPVPPWSVLGPIWSDLMSISLCVIEVAHE